MTTPDQLEQFLKQYPRFSDLLDGTEEQQIAAIMNGAALMADYNPEGADQLVAELVNTYPGAVELWRAQMAEGIDGNSATIKFIVRQSDEALFADGDKLQTYAEVHNLFPKKTQ